MSVLKLIFRWISYWICHFGKILKNEAQKYAKTKLPNVHRSAVLGASVIYYGPKEALHIGANSYINDAIIVTGENSIVKIGANCTIGYRVSLKAVTHDLRQPTPKENGGFLTREQDIVIGDNCWIGDNVFVKEGVEIGDYVIVGANSVVTKSIPSRLIVGGVPAKVIRSFEPDKV